MGKFWNGETSLPVAFWVYGYAAPFGIGAALAVMGFTLAPGTAEAKTFLIALLAYWAFWCVGTWRSASKYQGPKVWSALAKVMIAAPLATIIIVAIVATTMSRN